MAQTVKSSDFVLGSSCAGLHFGLLVVSVKCVVSIDPLVIAVGPDQLYSRSVRNENTCNVKRCQVPL
jgi:hypothetical protein